MAVGALLIDHCKGGRQSMHIFSKWSSSAHLVLCGYLDGMKVPSFCTIGNFNILAMVH